MALLVIAVLTAVPRVTAALERLDGAFTELEGAMGTLDRLDAARAATDNEDGTLDGRVGLGQRVGLLGVALGVDGAVVVLA